MAAKAPLGARLTYVDVAERRWRAPLAPLLVAFVILFTAFAVMRPDTSGDEPHYLMAAQSLAFDGDLDVTNDYASRERTLRVTRSFPLEQFRHAADLDGSGKLRPLHGVGLSVLLAPAVGIGGLRAAQGAMVLIAALLADQLLRLLRDLRLRRGARTAAWIAVVGCSPLLVFASQIYPEVPAALLIVVALRVMVGHATSPRALALGATAGTALVWLHVRYIPLAMGVFAGLVIAAAAARRRDRTGGVGAWAAGVVTSGLRDWRAVLLPVLLPYAIGAAAFASAFQFWYGNIHPTAPYRPFSTTTAGDAGWTFLYDYVLADILSPVHGWIPYVPVHWLGLAALGVLLLRFGWPAAAVLAVAVGYELLLASAAPNVGWGLPARYLLPVLPLIAIPIAVALQHVRPSRWIFVPLLAMSIVFGAAAVRDHYGLYPIDDSSRIYGVRSVAHLFPIPLPPDPGVSFRNRPGQFAPRTGVVQDGSVVARAGRDAPGFVMWGPYAMLREGSYRARFPLTAAGVAPDTHVATIEVAGAPPSKVYVAKVVTAREVSGQRPTRIPLVFGHNGGYLIETRVFFHGRGSLRVGPVRVAALGLAPGRPYPDWALALLWVVGTVVAGLLLVRWYRRDDELVGEEGGSKASKPVRELLGPG
jgi:hypothetical protein